MKRRIPKERPEASSEAQLFPIAPGKFVTQEVKPEDIGAELLPILSRGLYTDPRHAIREYVQNGVDSGAAVIRIKLTGNSIIIRDDGSGMKFEELVGARRFGVSSKNVKEHVGFRGIGIYSGYDLCSRLSVTTYSSGATMQCVLEFNFDAMRKRLEADKKKSVGTPLHELIERHTRFKLEPSLTKTPGTTVVLEEVSPHHIRTLRDSDALKNYILRNLPVDFDAAFEHRNAIKEYLKQHVPGYRAVRIIVEIREGERVDVVRPAIPRLQRPVTRLVKAPETGETIAVVWGCLHNKNARIPDDYAEYRGFVYKTKGFTIGDNRRFQPFFKHGGAALHAWYTGEVYIVDEDVVPNTERDDFEANPAYEVLKSQIQIVMEDLNDAAYTFQSQQHAATKLGEWQRSLDHIEGQFKAGIGDPASMFSDLENIVREIKQQRKKLPPALEKEGKVAERRAADLRSKVHRLIQEGAKKERKREAGAATGGTESRPADQDEETEPGKLRIAWAVEQAGLQPSGEIVRVFELVEEVLAAVLHPDAPEFEAVLEGIESAIANEFERQP